MAQKILFLHGFFASGTCIPALALKEYFSGKATVLSPDLPLHPQETLDFIQRLCNQEQPDILVGNSNGSFLAQIVASKNNIPALLGNPHFEMTRFLMERIGSHEYKSPRANGNQQLVIILLSANSPACGTVIFIPHCRINSLLCQELLMSSFFYYFPIIYYKNTVSINYS